VSWPVLVAVVGWTSTIALLIGYALVSSGRLAGAGRTYQVVNVLGSIGLGIAAFTGGVWPSVALNGVWALIGLVSLHRLRARRGAPDHPGDDAEPELELESELEPELELELEPAAGSRG